MDSIIQNIKDSFVSGGARIDFDNASKRYTIEEAMASKYRLSLMSSKEVPTTSAFKRKFFAHSHTLAPRVANLAFGNKVVLPASALEELGMIFVIYHHL